MQRMHLYACNVFVLKLMSQAKVLALPLLTNKEEGEVEEEEEAWLSGWAPV